MFGAGLDFEIRVNNAGETAQSLMIDYAIHHVKADGSLLPKVFKCKTITLAPRAKPRNRAPPRGRSPRRYYPGEHRVAILINGAESASQSFLLVMPD